MSIHHLSLAGNVSSQLTTFSVQPFLDIQMFFFSPVHYFDASGVAKVLSVYECVQSKRLAYGGGVTQQLCTKAIWRALF